MNARFSTNGRMPKLQIPLVLLVLVFLSVQHVAHAAMPIDNHPSKGEIVLLTPSAYPYALPAHAGKQTVRISVPVQLMGNRKAPVTVFLRRSGTKQSLAMNDLGKMGDFISRDGIHGVYVQIDTDKVKPDSCLNYEAFIKQGASTIVSPPVQFCVSSFPVGIAKSKTDKPVVLHDGERAVADEVVLYATPKTSAATIRDLASSINAKVVGSILPLNLYQLKLPSPASAEQLLEIVAQLRARTSSVEISVNLLGQGAMHINDTDFNSQHGLRLVVEQDQHGIDSNAWDAGGTGNGVTVVVLDTGLESSHPDLDATWTCQNVPLATAANSTGGILTPLVPVVLIPCTDTTVGSTPAGHGTEVAGVIAAKTNNSVGVAGVAFGSKIHAIKLRDFSLTGMTNGFMTAAGYVAMDGNAKVINASFAIEATPGSALGAGIPGLCSSLNSAVTSGFGAVVVNAVGNNSNKNAISLYSENFYPARCNDASNVAHIGLVDKSRLITVSNSTSGGSCGSVDQLHSTSNYGAWVDIAAPGCDIHTTTRVGTGTAGTDYINVTGNSFSAPLVAGAAAILTSCGVPLNQIEATLKGPPEGSPGANVYVPYPLSTSATKVPRLDVYHALQQRDRAPTGISMPAVSLNEGTDTSAGIEVGTLTAVDPDSCDHFSFSIAGGADAVRFSISGAANDRLRLTAGVLDYESKTSYAVIVRVTDFNGLSFDQPLTVSVNDLNDTPPVITTPVALNVNESTVFSAPLSSTDVDTVGINPANFSISGGADAAKFSIVGTNLTMPAKDYEAPSDADANNSYVVQVSANDGANTTVKTITVTVNDVNDNPPVITTAAAQSVNENAAFSVPLSSTDVDTVGITPANFSISGGADAAQFSIVGTKLTMTAKDFESPNDADANNTYVVQLSANDGVNSVAKTITVTVHDVNDTPPVITTPTALNVNENAAFSVPMSSTDVDTVGITPANFSISGGADAGQFSIVAANLTMMTKNYEAPADADTNNTYVVQVSANDGVNTAVSTITVTVNNVNDAPTGRPYIDGVRTVGQTLTARTSTSTLPNPIADEDGLGTFHYQWLRGSTPVGTDSDTYTLVAADLGAYMAVCISYTDGGGHAEQVCSGADALAVGDPHLITVDGLHYDFQSAGEFVALRGRNGLEIQTRHTPVSTASAITDPYSGLSAAVSINTAVAARVGKHRVTLQVSSAAAPADMLIRVDGVITTLPANGLALGIAGRVQPLPDGAIQIDFPDQTTLLVTRGWWAPHAVWYLNLTVLHTPAYEGLMGARAAGSWLPRLSDGSALGAMPANLQDRYVELYERFANSWRVSDKTSLFDYAPETSTQTYTFVGWPKIKPPYIARGPVAKPAKPVEAERACRGIKNKVMQADCIFDVRVTGNAGFAKTYLIHQGILAGLTRTRLQVEKSGSKDKEMLTYIATVERNANPMLEATGNAVTPVGTIQFMLDEKPIARPVKLDGKGQASVELPKSLVSDLHVMARYLPSKGSMFLTSSSPDETLKLSKQRGK